MKRVPKFLMIASTLLLAPGAVAFAENDGERGMVGAEKPLSEPAREEKAQVPAFLLPVGTLDPVGAAAEEAADEPAGLPQPDSAPLNERH